LILEKLPFFALSAASCVVTFMAQGAAVRAMLHVPFDWRLENALVSYVTYLGQTLWPVHLAVIYPLVPVAPWEAACSGLFLALVTGLLLWKRTSLPALLTGWLWYLGMLVPVIGLVQVGAQAHADRYTYLPQIGLCLAVAWGAVQWCGGWRHRRLVLGSAGAAVIGALAAAAYVQAGYWQDSISLWKHTIACTSENWVAHANLGNALASQGRMSEAIEQFELAVQILPNEAKPHLTLGNALASQGRFAEAVEQFERAVQLKPDNPQVHLALGRGLASQGKLSEAIPELQQALKLATAQGNTAMAENLRTMLNSLPPASSPPAPP
jgi:Flp pilus assembly protein TadD